MTGFFQSESDAIPSPGILSDFVGWSDPTSDLSTWDGHAKSMASIENTQKTTNCMPYLGSAHLQDDEYSCELLEEINEPVLEPVKIGGGEIQLQQQQLFADANLQLQNDFKRKLPQHLAKVDSNKELNIRQEHILESSYEYFNGDLSEDNCLKSLWITQKCLIEADINLAPLLLIT
ncbi:unnamed protein product [Adineta ricciae]|uniref:Uncharacterized protein n=1 Tax=Adineta ricciae TaxID=249248 RepID=A0A814YRJ8_ADIRI|nr:unnamed protein product [Adineta ricciae]